MAEKESKGVWESIWEDIKMIFKEMWPAFLIILICYLAWEYNLVIQLLALLGTIFLGWWLGKCGCTMSSKILFLVLVLFY